MSPKKLFILLTIFGSITIASAQNGFQPWKAKFKEVEIKAVSDNKIEYLSPKGSSKFISTKKVEFYRSNNHVTYPNDFAFYLTGKQKIMSFDNATDSLNFYFKLKNNKLKKVERNTLFSYYKDGKEYIVFKAYITANDSMSVNAVRSYSEGGRDARRFYKKPYGAIGNFVLGAAGGYFLGPYGIIPAGIYTGVEAAIPPYTKGKQLNELTKGRIENDLYYRQGFLNQVRKRRAIFSSIGGVAGFAIGWGVLEYQKSQE